jgi:glycerol-3-phosphate dehydrogenase
VSESGIYDLAVIGGGINGCGIARDAAGRGYSVYLCEQDDLASGTSSRSTKLIHGGLRYLEHFEFRLVREALREREVVLSIAPHIVRPMRFVLPWRPGLRPAWMLMAGLFLYDHLGGRHILEASRRIDLRADPAGEPLRDPSRVAFEYADCWVDDARLVVLNAVDARTLGAVIETRTRLLEARRKPLWTLAVGSGTETPRYVRARALVNAAGPWVDRVAKNALHAVEPPRIRLVRGAHIVVRKLFDHDRSYIFQNDDGRIVFAIPYEGQFTLIGTTDEDHRGDDPVRATDADIAYLLAAANASFKRRIGPEDIVWSFAGLRPLQSDGTGRAQDASRDYTLLLDTDPDRAPLLTVVGGKITTYRKLAEAALARLTPLLPAPGGRPAGWTASAPLPGGDFAPAELARLVEHVGQRYPFIAADERWRLVRTYGTRLHTILNGARTAGDLGRRIGGGPSEGELNYLVREEFARTAEDVLWRRTKLGLHLDDRQRAEVETYLSSIDRK